jgi:hypothetical protein
MTSKFDSANPLLYNWSVYTFCLFHIIQKLFNIFVSVKSALWAEILGGFWS